MALTTLQIALLFLAWQAHRAVPAEERTVLPLAEIVDIRLNPSPPPPQREFEPAPPGGSLAPSAAPIVRPVVPQPPVSLTELRVPLTPIAPDIPAIDREDGVSVLAGGGIIGAGDGLGRGRGSGDGSGEGGGQGREQPRQLTLTWAPGFRMSSLRRYYPDDARRRRITGRARLDCLVVQDDFVTDCRLLREWPAGLGFGEAALRAQDVYRLRLHDQFGRRVYDERVTIDADFPLR